MPFGESIVLVKTKIIDPQVNLEGSGPGEAGGDGEVCGVEAERCVFRLECKRRLISGGMNETVAAVFNGVFQKQRTERIVVVVFEAAPVLRPTFFEGIIEVVDDVF